MTTIVLGRGATQPENVPFEHWNTRGTRVYTSARGRKIAIARFKQLGFNYFTSFKDVQGYGLSFAAPCSCSLCSSNRNVAACL